MDQKVKIKESEKSEHYLDLSRELKKQWNMRVTVISVVIGILGTGTERVGSYWTNRDHPNYSIVEIVLETTGGLLSLRLQWETIS